jgi:hypothetical protein
LSISFSMKLFEIFAGTGGVADELSPLDRWAS